MRIILKYTRLALLCLPLLFAQYAVAQSSIDAKIASLLKTKPIRVDQHPFAFDQHSFANDTNILYWPMYFSSSFFQDSLNFNIPNKQEIASVHLVYSRYRQVDTFNQPRLNEKRFFRLAEKHPEWYKLYDPQYHQIPHQYK